VKKRTIPLLGRQTDVTEVEIVDRKETPSEYKLDDGSVIRFVAVPTAVYRVDGQYNADGQPVYLILHGTVLTPTHVPDELMRK
jgi:hypothetical protein